MIFRHNFKVLSHAALLVAVLLLASCASYHAGAPGGTVAIGSIATVQNDTPEPEASTALQKALRAHFQSRPGVSLKGGESVRPILRTRVVEVRNSSLARAEVRNSKDRDRSDNAYQGVLFRIDLTVEYRLENQDSAQERTGRVTGRGDLPLMHDRNLPLQNAIRAAANDAARQIAEELSDLPATGK